MPFGQCLDNPMNAVAWVIGPSQIENRGHEIDRSLEESMKDARWRPQPDHPDRRLAAILVIEDTPKQPAYRYGPWPRAVFQPLSWGSWGGCGGCAVTSMMRPVAWHEKIPAAAVY